MIFNTPFQPFLTVDNDDKPERPRQVFRPFAPLDQRTALATKALDQAERDLEGARKRASVADEKRLDKLEHEATMAERKRIVAILASPVAARLSSLAKRVAIESDSPADEAVAALEQYEREKDASSAKTMADQIVHMGQVRRGLAAATVSGAGPKVFVKTSAEEIVAAAAKAREPTK